MEVFSLAIAALGTGQSGVVYTLGYIKNLFLSILLNLQVISKHTNCSCWPLFPFVSEACEAHDSKGLQLHFSCALVTVLQQAMMIPGFGNVVVFLTSSYSLQALIHLSCQACCVLWCPQHSSDILVVDRGRQEGNKWTLIISGIPGKDWCKQELNLCFKYGV